MYYFFLWHSGDELGLFNNFDQIMFRKNIILQLFLSLSFDYQTKYFWKEHHSCR